jgi:hypothetical protein
MLFKNVLFGLKIQNILQIWHFTKKIEPPITQGPCLFWYMHLEFAFNLKQNKNFFQCPKKYFLQLILIIAY